MITHVQDELHHHLEESKGKLEGAKDGSKK